MNKKTTNLVDLAFRFTPSRLSLNFVATVGERGHRNIERLPTPSDLARWCTEAGLLRHPPVVSATDLVAAQQLREAIYQTVRAVSDRAIPNPKDIAEINLWAEQLPLIPQLGLDGGSVALKENQCISAVLSEIARDAIDLLGSPLRERIKACANPKCAMLFLDTSRPGQRRWCSMEGNGCGNRAKKAAYRHRQTDRS
jgi:predicted RNA-binding Zn ribbon-like protein